MNSSALHDIEVPMRDQPRIRPGAKPTISVVIASNRAPELLDACLASLVGQCRRAKAELIVARAGDTPGIATLAHLNPPIRLIAAPANTSIPQLRGAGMAVATGDIVALTEDHCIADPHWIETLLRGAADGADVIGGGMDNARRDRAVDWGAYFAEYGFFSTTRPPNANTAALLTGANVAYSRRVLDHVVEWARSGEWENVAHQRLLGAGRVLRFIGAAAVRQNKSYRFWEFCTDRFEHGRDYARKRLAEEKGARRWMLFMSVPLLPFVLTSRVARAAASTRWPAFLRALPATFAFLSAWSLGEAVGYWRGPFELRPALGD